MFTNRISKPVVVLLILAVAFVTVSFATHSASLPMANRSYDALEQIRAGRSVVEFNSAAREYQLGERYGVTPEDIVKANTLREYWLGERYGATPLNSAADSSYDQIDALRVQRDFASLIINSVYDMIEQVRIERAFNADRSYDQIEDLRLEP